MVRVSAIVSAYKAELYIKARLENLLAQCEKPEIVVVCEDSSIEHKIAFEYPVKIVITDGIPSLPVAWNLGIKKAKGTYITNANCDDELKPEALRKMADMLDGSGASVFFSETDIQYPGKDPAPWKRNLLPQGIVEGAFEKIAKRCTIGAMPMWKKSLHKQHGYFDETRLYVADYDFWLRLAARGETFYYYPKSLGVYAHRDNSLEHANKHDGMLERKEVRKLHENWYKSTQQKLYTASV